MRRMIAFLGCTAIAAAACFYGVPDVVNRAGNGNDATTGDGSTSDAAKLADGAIIDAGPDFCSTVSPKPYFCDDFDFGSQTDAASWGPVAPILLNQPLPTIDNGDFDSYPNSLHFSIAKNLPTTRLGFSVQGFDVLEIAFDVKATGSPRSLGGFVNKNGNDEEDILVVAVPDEGQLHVGAIDEGIFSDGGTYTGDGHSAATVDLTKWVHADLTLTFTVGDGGSLTTETLLVNGATIDSNVPVGSVVSAASTYVELYGECEFGNACDVRFDNVVVNRNQF